MEGADGLKTGYTKEGGYGMVGSAVQNGTRLIVVINGLEDPDDRATEAKKMLEWGFRNFETRHPVRGRPAGRLCKSVRRREPFGQADEPGSRSR